MNNEITVPELSLESLKVIAPVGRGAKGVVFLVKDEESNEKWALKVILRELIEKRKTNGNDDDQNDEYRRVTFEQQVLSMLNHPLLPTLRGVVNTDKIIGYAMNYCSGRDLNSLRKQQSEKMFSVNFIRFYGAEILLALEHLHSIGIAYRDLKPENIMIQESGHIMLVDFDLSRKLNTTPSRQSSPNPPQHLLPPKRKKRTRSFLGFCSDGIAPEYASVHAAELPEEEEKSNSFVGTEEYVAPEVIQGHGHGFAVDWWSYGVVLYEMLYGVTPFKGVDRKETFLRILSKEPELVGETTPLRDLIRKLLIKEPRERIKVEEIKGHEFFKGVEWDRVVEISRPPYIPPVVESEVVEGKVGITKDDLEKFVYGIFETKIEKIEEEKNVKKEVWGKVLNNHPCENENFLVF